MLLGLVGLDEGEQDVVAGGLLGDAAHPLGTVVEPERDLGHHARVVVVVVVVVVLVQG